ncbi:MAG TPA: hypothetical protein VHK69_03005 [Chitinophagaceae bacterium]|jgi:hypothetical protein|nr:hypothetical protein [Chitinophagaceae bacterium]
MQKIYLLLRNNRQSGPFTLADLVQQSLRITDLIWVEGQSAGWRNPQEIESLQSFVPEATAKLHSALPVHPVTTPRTANPEGIIQTPDTSAIPARPAFIPKKIHVSLPAGKAAPVTPPVTPPPPAAVAPAPDAEESPEEKLKQKADDLYRKIQAYNQEQQKAKETGTLDTKYSRSLEDIKEEYSEWMHRTQKKRFRRPPSLLRYAGAAVILAGLFFTGRQIWNNSDATASPATVAPQTALTQTPQATKETDEEAPESTPTPQEEPIVSRLKEDAPLRSTPVDPGPAVPQKKAMPPASRAVVETQPESPAPAETSVVIEELPPAPASRNGTRQRRIRTEGTEAEKEVPPPVTAANKPKTSASAIGKQIQLSEKYINSDGRGINGLQLTVYNNSDQFVNVVAVDVSYYRNSDKLLEKKTLYFNNIPPRSRSSLPAPDNRRATTVQYQVGLISTENGLFYVKQ